MNSNLSPAQFSAHRLDFHTGTSQEVSRGVSHELASMNASMWRTSDPKRYGAVVVPSK